MPTTLASGELFGGGIAVDGSRVYFGAGGTNTTLRAAVLSVPVDGGAVSTIVAGTTILQGIAYWSNRIEHTGGIIYKLTPK